MYKKILIIVPSFHSGGTVSSLINFVSLINKSRYHVSVFAITNSGPNKAFVAEHCTIIGDNNNDSNGNLLFNLKRCLKAKSFIIVKTAKKLLEKLNIDISPFLFKQYVKKLDNGDYDYILAFQEGQATLFGSYFKSGTRVAWVRSEYSRFIDSTGNKYKACYNKYDKIVCVSNAALKSYLSIHPQDSHKALVQYNFLNDKRIISLSKEIVKDLWDNQMFSILTLGRIDPVKRVSEIPRLSRMLLDMKLKFRWIILGGVAVEEEYRCLLDNINKYQVQDCVSIIGNRPNPYPYVKNCNLLVSLSISETFNNTLTEAKILGIPVVTTDYPCAYESIENNKEGVIVSFDNICSSIAGMIEDKESCYSTIKNNLSLYKYNNDFILQHLYDFVLN